MLYTYSAKGRPETRTSHILDLGTDNKRRILFMNGMHEKNVLENWVKLNLILKKKQKKN